MRILIINTSKNLGGAAIAAKRLTDALNRNGAEAVMLTQKSKGFSFYWERLIIFIYNRLSKKNLFTVSIANSGEDITSSSDFKNADIIHLHWINQGFLSLDGLKTIFESQKPIVWTLHDMWPCTAICHHAYTCDAYMKECKNCHFLQVPGPNDLANKVFKKKKAIWKNADIHVVTVSTWLADKVRKSSLLGNKQISVIPNTISLNEFSQYDKTTARKELKLPDCNIIIFGAAKLDDPIKGFNMLAEALKKLIDNKRFGREELHLILFGNIKNDQEGFLSQIPVSYSYYGLISDTSKLSQLFSASDVVVSASYYETFGQTLIEAQACGCIPVSFNNSGQTDIIRHKDNGYLAEYLSVDDLANGIEWSINKQKQGIDILGMRQNVINNYSEDVVAKQYLALYNKLLEQKQYDQHHHDNI